jgi:hypothetical protein
MAPEEREQLGDELERESEKLERESKRLGEEIEHVRSEWRAKQRDGSVPGAVEDDSDASGGSPEVEGGSGADTSPEPETD